MAPAAGRRPGHFVNVGVLGRPENDGRTPVRYAVLEAAPELRVEFVPVAYEHERLAAEMGGAAAGGVRRDGADGVVDDVFGDPAGQGTPGGFV